MCGLCGLFGEQNHWSTRLEHSSQSSDAVLRRRLRAQRTACLNRMLAPQRLTVSDWQGSSYQISSATGKTELADNLSQIWLAVEKITGRPFDPLA
ncbi:hypothetical protein A7P95_04435 [Eikenella longinqua]|uniref:Uncharacterized protein n=1 Tax=Eikenella longinqua TaxID=1795827 RepID=A0A1A9RWW2_9NEIS|nr:hypothetical protein [Eikenella longinqua]OAM29199.1 hypothetical protein A7P95_04435 [Eikenella longinqua]